MIFLNYGKQVVELLNTHHNRLFKTKDFITYIEAVNRERPSGHGQKFPSFEDLPYIYKKIPFKEFIEFSIRIKNIQRLCSTKASTKVELSEMEQEFRNSEKNLVECIRICGPPNCYWAFPVEDMMGYVKNETKNFYRLGSVLGNRFVMNQRLNALLIWSPNFHSGG
jgi:hypothetical protein